MDLELLEKLLDTSRQLAETRRLDPLLNYAMQVALRLFNAEKGYLVLLGKGEELEFRVKQDWLGNPLKEPQEQISRTIFNRAVTKRQPIITADALHEPTYEKADSVQLLRLRSVMCVPLIARGRILGAIYLENRREKGVFEQKDLKPLGYFAAQVAVSIENAALNAELETRVDQRTSKLRARNEELDAFARTVAHDLRNPLSLVVGYAEILGEDLGKMPETDVREYLDLIAGHGRKMSDIIEALLTLAGVSQAKVELGPVTMGPIVQSALRRLRVMIKAHQAEVTIPDSWPAALGHGPWIEEVWVNYLNNAIKYGGRPPKVAIGAQIDKKNPKMVHFWVRDNGPGIKASEQRLLFRPFSRLHKNGAPGHGLGLSIVHLIVEKLGGRVSVSSKGQAGQGSTFIFTLPAAPGRSPTDKTLYHKANRRKSK